ncbi:MAG: endonuclease domain-containing protein [Candidatus Buchananbacteria bacterium]|nr:endonuclease domain-containing protein [Candidatus Buchananbacteria bacterium]
MLFNSRYRKPLRRKLRREIPRAEQILWKLIRNRKINGCKFRRQYSIGPYVVDFYCSELMLAIEVDGAVHFANKQIVKRDQERQCYIEYQGVTVIRFMNSDIYYHIDGVLERLYALTSPQPSPTTGEGATH